MHLSRYRPEVLEARLAALAQQRDLYAADNLAGRALALDTIQQIYQLLQVYKYAARWEVARQALYQQTRQVEQRLRAVDAAWVQRLREAISNGQHTPQTLSCLLQRYTSYRPGRSGQIFRGYEALDLLVQGLLRAEQAPEVVSCLPPEMVPYAPAPARVILDMVAQTGLAADAVFYDIGAGLGHVAILVHLLTGATVRGVEIVAPYCQHAQRCAQELGLSRVNFLPQDARQVAYTDGTVFFLYTPFTGAVLETVLASLARVAQHHPVILCTHGACTFEVRQQPWVRLRHAEAEHIYALAVFDSL